MANLNRTYETSLNQWVFIDILGAIAAYSFFPKKPSIKYEIQETNPKLIKQFKKQLVLAA
jgi:hypothetical protein